MNEAGNGNCGDDESSPLMLTEAEAVVKVWFMYWLATCVSLLILQSYVDAIGFESENGEGCRSSYLVH